MRSRIRSASLRSLLLMFSLVAAPDRAAAVELQVLHSFTVDEATSVLRTDTLNRYEYTISAPVIDADGTVYGTTYRRLVTATDPYATNGETRIWRWSENAGYDVVAKLDVDARSRNDLNGVRYDSHQSAGTWLTLGADGSVYGLAEFSDNVDSTGLFFHLGASGNVDVRYRFPSYRPDQYASGGLLREDADPGLRIGSRPQVKLVLGADGQFYGSTTESGVYYRSGGLFRLSPQGEATLMMGPRNRSEGLARYSQMTAADDGHIYGLNWHVQEEAPYGSDVYRLSTDAEPGSAYSVIGELTLADFSPERPHLDSLQQGLDGWLYGTSRTGGDQINQISEGGGVLYRLRTDGSGLQRVHTFSKPYVFLNDTPVYQTSADGSRVNAGMVRDAAGNFYGTTRRGGTHTQGAVFRLTPQGELGVLHAFGALDSEGKNLDGAQPMSGLALSSDGKKLYGMTALGGESGLGTVFEITIAEPPPQASITWTFNPITVGAGPNSGGMTILKWASAGAAACTASGGGNTPDDWVGDKSTNGELLISAAKAGVYTYSLNCTNADGVSTTADSQLTVRENAHEQYGNGGGSLGSGLLATLACLALLRTRRKRLTLGLLALLPLPLHAATLTVLHDFTAEETTSGNTMGYSVPVRTASGALYGTTWRYAGEGAGATRLWKWTADAGYRVLHTLPVSSWVEADGYWQGNAGTWLTLGANEVIYGVAEFSDDPAQNGRFFRLDEQDQYVELRRFPTFRESQYVRGQLAEAADPALIIGQRPRVPLTLGPDGRLYGAMHDGGQYYRMGSLFAIDGNGDIEAMKVIHSIQEGYQRYSAMTAASDGKLYGMNWHFGESAVDRTAMGTRLYSLTPNAESTAEYRVINELFRQDFMTGDRSPEIDSLIEGADGALYGTCFECGDDTSQTTAGGGVLYRVPRDGSSVQRMHTFSKPYVFLNDQTQSVPSADGAHVNPGLARDADGNLYGTTMVGGADFGGVIWRLAPDGRFSALYSFPARDAEGRNVEGANPRVGVVVSADGRKLYGTASTGGAHNLGTLFELTIEEPAPQAAISWTFNPITVGADLQAGGATILSWSSVNATSCTAAGGGNAQNEWTGEKALSGRLLITAAKAGEYTYSLICSNDDGATTKADSKLTVRENAHERYGNGGGAFGAGWLALLGALALMRLGLQAFASKPWAWRIACARN